MEVAQLIVAQILLLVLVFLLMGVITASFYFWYKNRDREKNALKTVALLVRLPQDNDIKVEAAEQMFTSLHSLKLEPFEAFLKKEVSIAFEIVAKKEDIAFYLAVPEELRDFVEKIIQSAYPEAEISEEEHNVWTNNAQAVFCPVTIKGTDHFPIKTYKELANDGLAAITSALSKMGADEGAVVQFIIQPEGDRYRQKVIRAIQKKREQKPSDQQQAVPEVDSKEIQAKETKVEKPLFKVSIRVCVNSPDKVSAESHLRNIVSSFAQFDSLYLSFSKGSVTFKKSFMVNFIYRYTPFLGTWGMLTFNSEELATMVHFPNKTVETHHIRFLYAKDAPAPREIPNEGLFLGKSTYRGLVRNIYMSLPDRQRHMYIIGKTGTGKSEFLKEMILQDIASGHGVCAVDPHGEFVEDILTLMPASRAEDVIYFNPSDLERPMGMNMIESDSVEQRQRVVNDIIGLMYKLFDPHHQGIIGPRFEHAIRNTMLTIMYQKGTTLVELVRALTNDQYIQTLLPLVEDSVVKRYWTDQMAQTSDFHKSETLDYIVSKFGKFVTNPTIRNIVGQSESAFNFRKAMDEKKIILCNLSKGILGEEDSKFLGLVLVPKILAAAMSRQDIPMEQRHDFFLYVDEFQNYATDDFASILSEARKYRLNLIVANQYIGQIEDNIRNAVFGNVGTMVSFRVGVDDAKYLANEFTPIFNETDLANVEKFHVYIKTIVKNQPVPPFSMSLEKDMKEIEAKTNKKLAQAIKQLSRLKYGQDRAAVEADIESRVKLI
jgi:hypothetical protein